MDASATAPATRLLRPLLACPRGCRVDVAFQYAKVLDGGGNVEWSGRLILGTHGGREIMVEVPEDITIDGLLREWRWELDDQHRDIDPMMASDWPAF